MDEARRRRFKVWFAQTYGADAPRAKFIEDTTRTGFEPLTKGRVSQLFNERLPFSEQTAVMLAKRLGLDDDFFLKDLSDMAFDAGLMLDAIQDEEQRLRTYALWTSVRDLVRNGQPVVISVSSQAQPAVQRTTLTLAAEGPGAPENQAPAAPPTNTAVVAEIDPKYGRKFADTASRGRRGASADKKTGGKQK